MGGGNKIMRFETFVNASTSGFYDILTYLENYATDKIANIATIGWIKLRESLSADEQNTLLNKINEYFNTDIKNIYYIKGNLIILPIDWKHKFVIVPKIWEELNGVLSVDSTILAYGLLWLEFIMEEPNEIY
jgi:hypothetical protein